MSSEPLGEHRAVRDLQYLVSTGFSISELQSIYEEAKAKGVFVNALVAYERCRGFPGVESWKAPDSVFEAAIVALTGLGAGSQAVHLAALGKFRHASFAIAELCHARLMTHQLAERLQMHRAITLADCQSYYSQSPGMAHAVLTLHFEFDCDVLDWVIEHFPAKKNLWLFTHVFRFAYGGHKLDGEIRLLNHAPELLRGFDNWTLSVSQALADQIILHGYGRKLRPMHVLGYSGELSTYWVEVDLKGYLLIAKRDDAALLAFVSGYKVAPAVLVGQQGLADRISRYLALRSPAYRARYAELANV